MIAPAPAAARLWLGAQWAGVAITLALLGGLVMRPEGSLNILWNVLIPLVPASLLVAPMLWRNVCPLATLNLVSNRAGRSGKLGNGWLPRAGLIGMVLLVVLVPARRFVFNADGTILAVTIGAVAVLALGLGFFFDAKAGFCNSICPVLPVERLYGQSPLVRLSNPRCTPCTMCTSKGCIDLAPHHSIELTLGETRRSTRWLLNGYGAFAAAFPGFIIGYGTLTDGPLSTAASVYTHIALWCLGSYLVVAALMLVLRLSSAVAMVLLGTVAAGLYYWYAAAAITAAFELPSTGMLAMRVAAFALVALWAMKALPRALSSVHGSIGH